MANDVEEEVRNPKYLNPVTPPDIEWRLRQGSAAAGPQAPPPNAFPWVVVPPSDGEHFVLQDEADSVVAEVRNFAAPTATIVIPAGYRAVIAEISFYSTAADGTLTGSAFRVLIDSGSPAGFTTIRIPQTGGTGFWETDKAFIRVAQNQTIGAQFINALGAAHHVGFSLHGWYWPASLGE